MPTTRRLKGRTIAALAADGFDKVELIVPLRALQATGAKVDVVYLRRGRIRGVARVRTWSGRGRHRRPVTRRGPAGRR